MRVRHGASKTKRSIRLRMKILLINPPVSNRVAAGVPEFIKVNEGVFPPLGLLYIAAHIKANTSHEVAILDAIAQNMSYSGIERFVRGYAPDIAGITAHTQVLPDVIKTADTVKKAFSAAHVCIGGPHVSAFGRLVFNIRSADSAVSGEGEVPFLSLVDSLASGNAGGGPPPGVMFRDRADSGGPVDAPDIDKLNFPLRRMLALDRYNNPLGLRSKMTTMISSRGCPYKCAFCSTPHGRFRARTAANVVEEMEECRALGIREIHFVDDTFNYDIPRVFEICELIRKRRLDIKWSFRGRSDRLSGELLASAGKAGCFRIHIGVETDSDEGLKRLRKDASIAQMLEVFRSARKERISTVAYFLLGCPHERSENDVRRAVDFSVRMGADYVLYNVLTLYPGTQLFKEYSERFFAGRDPWQDFISAPSSSFLPPVWEEWMPREKLMSLLFFAYRRFYLRPGFLMAQVAGGPGGIFRKAGMIFQLHKLFQFRRI